VEELNRRFRVKRTAQRAMAAPAESVPEQALAQEPARPLTAQDRAERWLLGILLIQPHRWHEVQQKAHLEDFVNEAHRRLAEIYWDHQRDEGEPVFNEFLGTLREPLLAELAIQAVEEVESLDDPEQ